ncbi:MAG: hypothetical protein MPW14_08450 [Candidatus Manganitrophus sp.]|nr:MAG: hypothetical protein MPW14_08450 [Candidatus Manganitrophus sp.]
MPLFISEELALEQLLRKGRAVDFDEGHLAPSGMEVNGARHHPLAGAGLPPDQNGHIGSGDLLDDLLDLIHRRTAGGEEPRGLLFRNLVQGGDLGDEMMLIDDVHQHALQILRVERLGHVVRRSHFHRGHDVVDLFLSDHDDRGFSLLLLQGVEPLPNRGLFSAHIEQNEIGRFGMARPARFQNRILEANQHRLKLSLFFPRPSQDEHFLLHVHGRLDSIKQ